MRQTVPFCTLLTLMPLLAVDCASGAEPPQEFTNSIGMKFKLIPAGDFMMGSPESDQAAEANERPQHKVRITKPFYLALTEVTQEQYKNVMGKNPSWFCKTGGGADEVKGTDTSSFPVEWVSWDDTVEFCKRLSTKEGQTYRLPTEAEWEFACRAGSTTRYGFGVDPTQLPEYAWFGAKDDQQTHSVGQKKPNLWGLYDMHGNVWEWCSDWYGQDYYAESPTDDPAGPVTGSHRVGRGGGYFNSAADCRTGIRSWTRPDRCYSTTGFRVAAVPSGQ